MPQVVSRAARILAGLSISMAALAACDAPAPTSPHPTSTPTARVDKPAPLDPEPEPGLRLPADVEPRRYGLDLRIDPEKATFSGKATIALTLRGPHHSLYLHGVDLRVSRARLVERGGASAVEPRVTALPEATLLRFDFDRELAPGDYTLEVEYEAPFGQGLAGFYRVEVEGRHYVFSQLEAIDARRAFPCFDEPSFKTPFDVTLTVPSGDVAVSNSPVDEQANQGATTRVRFAPTAKLPTYLVAIAVGPFDVVTATPIAAVEPRTRPLPLRGIAVKGKGAMLGEALEQHRKIVLALERYFGIAYPFDKLDILAVPDFSAGAMENAGAITYRDDLLLIDPSSVAEEQRRDVVGTAAHEVAHQWFGNLVTMSYWDDLWLNEAFATWMGHRITQELYPEWDEDLALLANGQAAMETDSLVSARKIRQPITSPDEIEAAFDDLTYSKGAALIGMFESFTTSVEFQRGIRSYLTTFANGNATTGDFLKTVFARSPRSIPESFQKLLDRPGVPRVSVRPVCEHDKTRLDFSEVSIERYLPLGSKGESKSDWAIPLVIGIDGQSWSGFVETKDGKGPFMSGSGHECPREVLPNPKGDDYVRYTPTSEQAKALLSPRRFPKIERGGRLAVSDALRAGFAVGTLDGQALLDGTLVIAKDELLPVASSVDPTLKLLASHYVDDATRPKLERYAKGIYGPRVAALGWEVPPPGREPAKRSLARANALEGLLLVARDPASRKEALARAKKALGVGTAKDPSAVPADLAQPFFIVAVQDGGPEVFDAVVAALDAAADPTLRRKLGIALASATSPALAARARAFYFDPKLRAGERLYYLFTLFGEPATREAAFQMLEKELPRVGAALPESVRPYLPELARSFCDKDHEDRFRALFGRDLDKHPGEKRTLENALERVHICAAIRERQQPSITKYLTSKVR